MNFEKNIQELNHDGFSIIEEFYSKKEIEAISNSISLIENKSDSFLESKDVFAIRQLIKHFPELWTKICTPNFVRLISGFSDDNYFLTKAIYFNKLSGSNWFVPFHQDISISVHQKEDLPNYKNWTFKRGQFGVQPPNKVLENTITLRIHLDYTDENNGALKVVPHSHTKGIIRVESDNNYSENEFLCKVKQGGIMFMKPLTFHASSKSLNKKSRRVIHLEFNSIHLHKPLKWLEYKEL